jgi:hypothetical protein
MYIGKHSTRGLGIGEYQGVINFKSARHLPEKTNWDIATQDIRKMWVILFK